MGNLKISQLASATSLAGTEVLPVVQGGATKKVTVQSIADLAGGGYTSYVAKLSLDETSTIVTTVLQNTTGKTINWQKGSYLGADNVAALFSATDSAKVAVFALADAAEYAEKGGPVADFAAAVKISWKLENPMQNDTGVRLVYESTPDVLVNIFVEVRIYA